MLFGKYEKQKKNNEQEIEKHSSIRNSFSDFSVADECQNLFIIMPSIHLKFEHSSAR